LLGGQEIDFPVFLLHRNFVSHFQKLFLAIHFEN